MGKKYKNLLINYLIISNPSSPLFSQRMQAKVTKHPNVLAYILGGILADTLKGRGT